MDLVTFTEEILNGKLYFSCSGIKRFLFIDSESLFRSLKLIPSINFPEQIVMKLPKFAYTTNVWKDTNATIQLYF